MMIEITRGRRNFLRGYSMANRYLSFFMTLPVLLAAGCSYRFVDPYPAGDYVLVSVRNATSEAGLAPLLEEEMRRNADFRESSANRLSVMISGFTETVESVSSDGIPVRQKLTMDVTWKAEGRQSSSGKEVVVRSYPYSKDPPTLDWNRSAAVRILTEMAARSVLENLGGQP
jgi:hypothetical protein